MTSQDKLNYRIAKGLHVCVGLDSDINKIPKFLLNENDPVYELVV